LRLLLGCIQPTRLSHERRQYQRQDSCLNSALFHKNLPSCRSAQGLTGSKLSRAPILRRETLARPRRALIFRPLSILIVRYERHH
jgi:hypothetical protein